MKKYFMIRIAIFLFYMAALWYGFTVKNNVGYTVMISAVLIGLVLNYINYRVNYKAKFVDQDKDKE